MSTVFYVAVASGDQAVGYQARFPDLPTCTAAAPDLAELISRAREAVRTELQRLADDGQGWPPATPIEQVRAEPPAAVLLIDVQVEDTPVRVNISIGEQLLKRLDAAAEDRGTTRSGFIAQAVRRSLGDKSGAGADFDTVAKRLQDELSAFGRKITESLGPDSTFSRSMADFDDRVTETVQRAADSVSAAMARRRAAEAAAKTDGDPPPRADATEH